MKEYVMVMIFAFIFIVEDEIYRLLLIVVIICYLLISLSKNHFINLKYVRKIRNITAFTIMTIMGLVLFINGILLKITTYFISIGLGQSINDRLESNISKYGININLNFYDLILLIVIPVLTFLISLIILRKVKFKLNAKINRSEFASAFIDSNKLTRDIFSILIFWFTFLPTIIGSFFISSIEQEVLMQLSWFILNNGIVYTLLQLKIFEFN